MESKIAKFTGTVEMEQALDRMLTAANDGFSGGRISKHDLLSWAVLHFERESFRDCVEQIRRDHFDQVVYLEAVLKQAKQARRSGEDAPDLSALLAPLSRVSKPERSRGRPPKDGETTAVD